VQAFLDEVVGRLDDGPAVMVVVTSTGGSTPRKTGARMLVFADGPTVGTVGGGWLELEATRLARTMLADGSTARVVTFGLRGPERSNTPMVCGGDVELLFQPL